MSTAKWFAIGAIGLGVGYWAFFYSPKASAAPLLDHDQAPAPPPLSRLPLRQLQERVGKGNVLESGTGVERVYRKTAAEAPVVTKRPETGTFGTKSPARIQPRTKIGCPEGKEHVGWSGGEPICQDSGYRAAINRIGGVNW